MDIANNIAKGLETLHSAVDLLKPVLKDFGTDKIDRLATLVNVGIEIASHTLEQIENGKVVADSRDAGVIRQSLLELQAENDSLAAYIANS